MLSEKARRCLAQVCVETWVCLLLRLLLICSGAEALNDLLHAAFLDLFAFFKLLIGNSLRKELIEVEFVITQELQTRSLHHLCIVIN